MGAQEQGEHSVLTVQGRLNLSNVDDFRDAVTEALRAGRARLIIDLGVADSVDSTGLGALIWAATSAQQDGGWLQLANVNERVRMLLKLANVTRLLPIVEDTESE